MDEDTILESKRLILRYQRESDVDFLIRLWTDEEITKYVGGPREEDFLNKEFNKIAKEPRKEEYDLWPIELKGIRKTIGYAGLIPKEVKGKKYLEISYFISKEDQGKGYATEISESIIKYAFERKDINEIIAIINPENEESKRVSEKIGMKIWGKEDRNGVEKEIYIIRK